MAIYKIINTGANKCLNISGNNVTTLRNHQKITLWSDAGTNEQKWDISSFANGVFVKSVINTDFGLNVYRLANAYTCDIYTIAGNETDTKVNFIASGNNYKIKLMNYDLYLTAGDSANDANVYWAADNSSGYQVWSCTAVSDPPADNKTLVMPVNTNQRYAGNPAWIVSYGCAVACAADVASYYDCSRKYTIADMINCGAGAEGKGLIGANVPKAGFKNYASGNYLPTIVSEIRAGRPVLVHCKNNGGNEHWTVAFKYVNGGTNNTDVYVLDPAGTPTNTVGEIRTLSASMSYNYNLTYINDLKLTYAK